MPRMYCTYTIQLRGSRYQRVKVLKWTINGSQRQENICDDVGILFFYTAYRKELKLSLKMG